MTSLNEVVEHYQRSIVKCQNDEKRLLHCINKLYKLPIKMEHLQQTGIGKTVNSLRKFEGEIGVAAKALVAKWKSIVVLDEEKLKPCDDDTVVSIEVPENASSQVKQHKSSENTKQENKIEKHGERNHKMNKHKEKKSKMDSSVPQEPKSYKTSPVKDTKHHKNEMIIEKHHIKLNKVDLKETCSSSSKNSSNRSDKKHGNKVKRTEKHDSSSKTDARLSAQSISNHNTEDVIRESTSRKRHRHHEPQSEETKGRKKLKTENTKSLIHSNNDGIDSTMGANFDDVLGMLDMPVKTSKSKSKSTSILNSSICNNHIEAKPHLLSPAVKLKPLDLSICLEFPNISTNYKPLPANQTVMSCVYNSSNLKEPKSQVKGLSDFEALSLGISSKTMRTKVYSGVKTGQIFQVPSLFDLCTRVMQKNIDAFEYTGGVPFEVLKHVLDRATPTQLLNFEHYNSYLLEDTDILWQTHVQRTFRTEKRLQNESWREMYLRCHHNQERKLNFLAESIKQSQQKISAPVRKTQLAYMDTAVKPPRGIKRKQDIFGTKSQLIATPAARVAALSSITPNAVKSNDVRLRANSFRPEPPHAASSKPKKAPLMMKALQSIRGFHKR